MKFFKTVLAVLVGIILFNILAIFVLFPLLGSLGKEKEIKVKSNAILYLRLDGDVAEIANDMPIEMPVELPVAQAEAKVGLQKLIAVINKAAEDKNIKGILLYTDNMTASTASVMQIAKALENFKSKNKLLYAYSSSLKENNWLLNKVCTKCYLNPVGQVEFNGYGMELTYFTGLLEKLGVQPEIFYAGNFKSATESFRLKAMSEENRLQLNELLTDIYGNYIQAFSKYSGIPNDSLITLANTLSVVEPADALKYKMVDGLKYEDEVWEELKSKLGYKKSDKINLETYKNYVTTLPKPKSTSNVIAVLAAEGTIVDGKGEKGTISEKEYLQLLKDIKDNKDVKALVLRINSPGGSAYTSEQIWYQLQEIKKRIPIVVSMGDLAASGGYYIATPANKIFANANTITGSIGAFGMMFNVGDAANQKLGITFDRVGTGPYADFGSSTRAWTDREKEVMNASINNVYTLFKSRVSKGRNLSMEQVEALAQGRIWSGQDAKTLHLVDELGDLQDAINEAKKLAKLDSPTYVNYPEEKTFFEKFVVSMSQNDETEMMKSILGENYFLLKNIKNYKNQSTIQTLMPFSVEVY
jgi:protease-4